MPDNFTEQLYEMGLRQGNTVLMHSSMKALKTDKTPIEFINDVISVIGQEGTLLIPAFTYKSVTPEHPYFDVKETEPCIGLIPGNFFRMQGVVRSVHPTHSVCAVGKRAVDLTSKHIRDETPVGANSPITRLLDCDGKILFIGDIIDKCTFMHAVEEIVGAPYALSKKRTHYFIKNEQGDTVERDMITHNFSGWVQEYRRIKNIMSFPDITTGKVGQADCFLIDASALLEKSKKKFKENPYYFVTDIRKYL